MLIRILAPVAGYATGQIVNLDPRAAAHLVAAGTAERAVSASAQVPYPRDEVQQPRGPRPRKRGR